MGIYEDWQIHTKTGFRPIKLQESRSGPHTNRTSHDNIYLLTGYPVRPGRYQARSHIVQTERSSHHDGTPLPAMRTLRSLCQYVHQGDNVCCAVCG